MAEATTKEPMREAGEDIPVSPNDDLTVLTAIREAKSEADQARRGRLIRNRGNYRAYLNEYDWSHKQKGQSKEGLPKTAEAIEQFSGFIKRALVGFGDWFDVEIPRDGPLLSGDVRKLMMSQ